MPDSINLFFFLSKSDITQVTFYTFGHDDLLIFAIYDICSKKWRKSRFTGTLWQCPRFSFPHRTCGNKSDKIIRLGTLLTELFSEYLKDRLGMSLDKETFICGACQNLNSSWRFIVTQRLGSLALQLELVFQLQTTFSECLTRTPTCFGQIIKLVQINNRCFEFNHTLDRLSFYIVPYHNSLSICSC